VPRVLIEKFEGGGAPISLSDVAALRRALEGAGVISIDEKRDGPGVKLRDRPACLIRRKQKGYRLPRGQIRRPH